MRIDLPTGIDSSTQQLGSFGLWFWGRFWEAILFLLFLDFIFDREVAWLIPCGFAALFVAFYLDPLAYGIADERGITYRRYFRRHFLSWERVATVEWPFRGNFGGGSRMKFAVRPLHSARFLLFFLDASLIDEFSIRFRGATPGVILWLRQKLEMRHHATVLPTNA